MAKSQLVARDGQARSRRMADRPVVAEKPGNAVGAKGPWYKSNAIRNRGPEIGESLQTPKWVWQFQTALDAQAKSERLVCESMNPLERKPDALAGTSGLTSGEWKRSA